ncbi:hypothetical protein AOLI_G00076530 [Acnodon oligacanthus]
MLRALNKSVKTGLVQRIWQMLALFRQLTDMPLLENHLWFYEERRKRRNRRHSMEAGQNNNCFLLLPEQELCK